MNTQPLIEEMIASWGEAKLMKDLDGKCRLVGGSEKDRAEAKEWMDKFMMSSRTPDE
jgi:hypothetical protein